MRKAAVVVVVLAVAVPSALAAAPGAYTVPLDTGNENVGNVTVDGTAYELYRYDNVLPYVSGYEFFGDERVEDDKVARRVARAYAWKTSVESEMDAEDIGELRGVGETARRARGLVAVPLRVTNGTLRVLGGPSGWNDAVVPGIDEAETALRTAREEVLRWNDRVGNASDDVVRFAEVAEELRGGNTTRHDELPRLAVDAETGLEGAIEASSAVSETLRGTTNRTGYVAEAVEDVPVVNGSLAPPLRRVESSLRNVTETVERFNSSASEAGGAVGRVRVRAENKEASLSEGWYARQTAGLRLYGTSFGAIGVLIGGYVYLRRRDHNM